MDDSGAAPAEEEPVDELAAAVSEDSGVPADESNVEAVDEPIELHTDEQSVATSEEEPVDDPSAGLIDDEDAASTSNVIPAEAEDDLLTDVTWPKDEDKDEDKAEEEFDEINVARAAALIAAGAGRTGDGPSDRQDDEWTDKSATEDAAESVAVADDVSGAEPTDEQAPEVVADGPVEAVETPPAEETVVSNEEVEDLLVDEIGPGFLPLRVDDLVPLDVPADPALGQLSNLPGVSPSEPTDTTSVEPESVAASPQPGVWKPEEIRGHPDNLSRVKGIGKVYRRRLYDAGIFTWHQLGQMSEDEIREIVHPFVSADVEQWPERARMLAERNGRIGAQYVGPPPDDLTEIQGIGSYAMQRLYKNGIWSFRQLAAIAPEELEEIIPISPSGGVIDHQRWIDTAGQLSQPHDG